MGIDSLFQPFQVRNLQLDNRWVMAAMSYYKNAGGTPDAAFAEYHRERSGDVGLVLTGGTGIDTPAANNHPNLANINEATAGAWRDVVDAVHAAGSPIAIQLFHAGALFNVAPGWRPHPLECPSGLNAEREQVAEPMTDAAVEATVEAFGRAAALAVSIGFDSVEIHGAHGFLIDQFFWEVTNRRTDRWGGPSIRERSAFAAAVVAAVRAAIGEDVALLMKVSQWKEQDFFFKMAPTPDDLTEWLGPLADAGVDVFDCSTRRFWIPEFEGSDLNLAGWVKRELGVPTISMGSVGLSNDVMDFFGGETSQRTPLDELVRRFERGDFDLVGIGRTLLSDPHWLGRVRAGTHLDDAPLNIADLNLGVAIEE
jgi:2,4-dienoyl-CoA reductase-like NADH-dependent reductase (Old Yellow Enzyme family)